MVEKTKEQYEEFLNELVTALADIEECDDAAYLNEGINDVIAMVEKFKFEEQEPEEHAACECEHVVESQFFQDHGCCRYCFYTDPENKEDLITEIMDIVAPTGWSQVEPSSKVFVVRKWVDETASIVKRTIKNYRAFWRVAK